MATQQEVIRNFMSVLDRTSLKNYEALDDAVRKTSGFSGWQAVIDAMYADCRAYGDEVFLKERCGIILDNADTGAITGSDAGGSREKTADSVIPETSGDWRLPTGASTTYSEYGVTVNWPNLDSLTEKQKLIIGGLYSWWIPESLQLIRDSYGFSFNESGTTVNTISEIVFENKDNNTLASVWNSYNGKGKTYNLTLNINMHYYNGILDDVNGTSDNGFCLDRVIAHEMTHALMAANIDYFAKLPHHLKEGAAELVHGIDDERRTDIMALAQNPDTLREILLSNAKYTLGYAAGYMALRYLARQASADASTPSTVPLPAEPKYSVPSTPSTTTNSSVRKLSVQEGGHYWLGGYDPLEGEAVSDYPNVTELDATGTSDSVILGGNANNNLIRAGSGQSSIWGGGSSSDTLQGGAARDMIWYGAGDGNDVVNSFTTGTEDFSDVLNLYSGGLAGVFRSGNAVRLSMADGGSLKVNTGAGADEVILYSTDGGANLFGAKIGDSSKANQLSYQGEPVFYQGGSGRDTLWAAGSDDKRVWLDGSCGQSFVSIEVLDGSQSSGADQLAGSGGEELILGGGGAASLWGGAGSGNDTLQAGSGENAIFYGFGEGNDVILNTSTNDRVMLYNMGLGHVSGADIGNNDVRIYTTAGQTLTVQGEARFTLGDGSTWQADHQTKQWSAV